MSYLLPTTPSSFTSSHDEAAVGTPTPSIHRNSPPLYSINYQESSSPIQQSTPIQQSITVPPSDFYPITLHPPSTAIRPVAIPSPPSSSFSQNIYDPGKIKNNNIISIGYLKDIVYDIGRISVSTNYVTHIINQLPASNLNLFIIVLSNSIINFNIFNIKSMENGIENSYHHQTFLNSKSFECALQFNNIKYDVCIYFILFCFFYFFSFSNRK